MNCRPKDEAPWWPASCATEAAPGNAVQHDEHDDATCEIGGCTAARAAAARLALIFPSGLAHVAWPRFAVALAMGAGTRCRGSPATPAWHACLKWQCVRRLSALRPLYRAGTTAVSRSGVRVRATGATGATGAAGAAGAAGKACAVSGERIWTVLQWHCPHRPRQRLRRVPYMFATGGSCADGSSRGARA